MVSALLSALCLVNADSVLVSVSDSLLLLKALSYTFQLPRRVT